MWLECEITKRDIRRGKKGDCGRCPGAIAIRRAIRKLTGRNVHIDLGTYTLQVVRRHGGQHDVLVFEDTPLSLRRFITNFDSDNPVGPLTFRLPVKAEAMRALTDGK